MAIYPDSKDGKLTGRWRVELQERGRHYSSQHDSHADALRNEGAIEAAWARSETLQDTVRPLNVESIHSIASVIQEAGAHLWQDTSEPETARAHVSTIGHIIGMRYLIDEVDTPAINRVIKELVALKKSNATVNRYLSHFRTFLMWAESRGLMSTPVAEIGFAWRSAELGLRPLHGNEEQRLMRILPDNIGTLVQVALETGCRRQDLLAIRADQLIGDMLHLSAREADGPRAVRLSPKTSAALLQLILDTRMPTERALSYWWARAALEMGLHHDPEFVFDVCHWTWLVRLFDSGIDLHVGGKWSTEVAAERAYVPTMWDSITSA